MLWVEEREERRGTRRRQSDLLGMIVSVVLIGVDGGCGIVVGESGWMVRLLCGDIGYFNLLCGGCFIIT